ncbi:MAG: hypothetical protein CMJ83_08875 [Planctomycetes bacterium]|nr:hypothetical protein [Planctomycetota bacterium]
MDRRSFIAAGVGAPLVFGFTELLSRESTGDVDPRPTWLIKALAKMKEKGLPGVIFVVPESKEQKRLLAEALHAIGYEDPLVDWAHLDGREPEAVRSETRRLGRELSATTVLICLDRKRASLLFGTEGNRLLISPAGRTLARATVDEKKLEPGFVQSTLQFAHGKRGEHLKDQVTALRARLPETRRTQIEEALAVLLKPGREDKLETSRRRLVDGVVELAPWLIQVRDATSNERFETRLQEVLRKLPIVSPSRLPFGTEDLEFRRGGCGSWVRATTPAPTRLLVACGMAKTRPGHRRFLAFLK